MRGAVWAWALVMCSVWGFVPGAVSDEIPYSVATWPRELGSMRAVLRVEGTEGLVRVHVPWRRHDPRPQAKEVFLVDAATGERLRNVLRVETNAEFGDFIFQPVTVPGDYYLYFAPVQHTGPQHAYVAVYPTPEPASEEWLSAEGLLGEPRAKWSALPEAKVTAFQARSEFDRFDPMEVIATAEEMQRLMQANPGPVWVFPEDRRYPVRMRNALPQRWADVGPRAAFSGTADRGEWYAFQLAVYAARTPVEGLSVQFGDLKSDKGRSIPHTALRCINTSGVDWRGRPFTRTVAVKQGRVQPLWCLVDIPENAAPGVYEGEATITASGLDPMRVSLQFEVTSALIPDHGVNDAWRMARLGWLDSSIGIDDEVVAPYTPLTVSMRTISCLGRDVSVRGDAMLSSVRAGNRELLAAPMRFVVESDAGESAWSGQNAALRAQGPGTFTWGTTQRSGAFEYRCWAKMEFDGYIGYTITLRALETTDVRDVRLEIPFRPEAVPYLMGMGKQGGYRPEELAWTWNVSRSNNAVWLGDVPAGLQIKLKGPEEKWDLTGIPELPRGWSNGGKGGCTVRDEDGPIVLRAYSGARHFEANEEETYRFGLLITPLKPLDPRHWNQRYLHQPEPADQAKAKGATIVNIHQGPALNPYINYPFLTADRLKEYIGSLHQAGLKGKIYYTVRELSNHTPEIWALRSLGTEIFLHGGGGGYSWLQEHLVSGYAPAWHEPNLPNDETDGAIAQTGLSRWHNYYLEGLGWLFRNVEIDGLYVDGLGYDREIMKRVRKVFDRYRPGALIDFHSGNNFDPAYGLVSPAMQYMEHMPYLDSLWFGEMYNYDLPPDYWLIEVSGIPFGLYSEMLQNGGNPFRGMLYGMTNRLGWQGDPRAIWKLWDDFGIAKARMLGYWDPACPVRTGQDQVLATAYVLPGKTLICVASWAPQPVDVKLIFDWKALGIQPGRARLRAPAMEGLQNENLFAPTDTLKIDPGKGYMLILEQS